MSVRDKNVLKYPLYFLEVTVPEDITFSSTIQTFFSCVSRIRAAKLTYKYSRIRSDIILKKTEPECCPKIVKRALLLHCKIKGRFVWQENDKPWISS